MNGIDALECCTPAGCLSQAAGTGPEVTNDLDAVKVVCNNDQCTTSGFMHRQCFDNWEASILHYLRSCGRARSWSERQRCQNLWTKKGYDLAFKVFLSSILLFYLYSSYLHCVESIGLKACGCMCGRGHLRKDAEWRKPTLSAESPTSAISGESDQQKKQQRRKAVVKLPTVATPPSSRSAKPASSSSAAQIMMNNQMRHRANSLSSTGSTTSSSGSSSPPETVSNVNSAVFFLSNNKNKKTPVKPADERER